MDENGTDPEKYSLVTPEQFAAGYLEKVGPVIRERRYERVKVNRDGNIVVINPDRRTRRGTEAEGQ